DLPYTAQSGAPVMAWDARARLLYVVAAGVAKANDQTSLDTQLLVIDSKLAVERVQQLNAYAGFAVRGMSYEPHTKLLFMALESKADAALSPNFAGFNVQVSAYDAARSTYAWPTPSIPVTGCPMLQSQRSQAAIAYNATTRSVYVACAPAGLGVTSGPG